MKSKSLKVIAVLWMLLLTACGGSGGSSNDDSIQPAPVPIPIDGGASNGLSQYYFFSKADFRSISTTSSIPTTSVGVVNQFFIQITSAQSADMNLGVFAPKCLVGASINSYAMVLLSGDGPSLVSVRTSSGKIEIEEISYDNNITQKKGEDVQVLAGDCNEGIFLSDDTTTVVMANDSLAVMSDSSGNIYIGLSKNVSLNPLQNIASQVSALTPSLSEASINSYHFWQGGAPLLGVTNQSSSGGYFDNGQFFGVYNGAIETAFGNGQASLALNTSTSIESYHTVVKGQGAYFARELRGASGIIDGKTVFFGSMTSTCINTQGSYTQCFGVDALMIASEQE